MINDEAQAQHHESKGIGVQAILDRRDEVLARLRARVGETTLDKV